MTATVCSRGPVGGQTLAYLLPIPSFSLSLLGQRPALYDDSSRQPEGKPCSVERLMTPLPVLELPACPGGANGVQAVN